MVCVKDLVGIIVSKNVVLERKDSLFHTAEIYHPILLPCLRFIIVFNSCTSVQAGEELSVLDEEGAISLFPGFWKHLK